MSHIALEILALEIFNLTSEVKFDLGDQSSFWSKVASLVEGFYRKILIWISIIALELWAFEIIHLTSEVKFDLGGQSSF